MRMWVVSMVVATAGAGAVLGGCAADKQYSPTALQAIQTREFDAGLDQTFDATVGSLFDLGYSVTDSDKRAGFVSAGRSTPPSFWAGVSLQQVQAKLDAVTPQRTNVRLNTISNGQTRVDEKVINEIFVRMEAYHLGAPPPSSRSGAK